MWTNVPSKVEGHMRPAGL